GAAGVDNTLHTDDGGNKGFPVAIIELVSGIEDGDGAAFVTATRLVVTMVIAERFRGSGNLRDYLVQGRLVALNLDDQGDVGFLGDLEMFFWQCIASSVTIAPSWTPSCDSNVCAAGISLDFSAISTWASTRDVS